MIQGQTLFKSIVAGGGEKTIAVVEVGNYCTRESALTIKSANISRGGQKVFCL